MAFVNLKTVARPQATPAADFEPAQVWVNIGHTVQAQNDQGEEVDVFIGLPKGLPLDQMAPVKTSSSSEYYSAIQESKNDLLTQLMKAAEKLQPGQSRIVNLQVELRRVATPHAPIKANENPFIKSLDL